MIFLLRIHQIENKKCEWGDGWGAGVNEFFTCESKFKMIFFLGVCRGGGGGGGGGGLLE